MIEKYVSPVSHIIGPPDVAVYIDATPDITCGPALRNSISNALAEYLEAGYNTFVACRQSPFILEVARQIQECFFARYPNARCIYFTPRLKNTMKVRKHFDIKELSFEGVYEYNSFSLLLLSCVGKVLCAVPTCKLQTSLILKRALKKGVPCDNVWSVENANAQVLDTLQKNAAYQHYREQIRVLCTGLDPQRMESLFNLLLGAQDLLIDLLSTSIDNENSTS